MRHSHPGSFREQASFLRRQFLQDGALPFTNVLTEEVIEQALTDGRKVTFEVSPDNRVLHPQEPAFFLKGTILNRGAGSGVVTIENPWRRKTIVVDMGNWKAPRREEH